jgi:tripartite-type tricarboxylate transporter receptor subunit TctC
MTTYAPCRPVALRRALLRALAAAPLAATGAARAQEAWPGTRPIRLVVPAPAGGGTDLIARALADRLRESLKATIVVENRAGATTAIGNEFVAQAAPDGHTLLFASPPGFTVLPHLRSVKYSLDDFEAVGAVGNIATMVVARNDLPVQSLRDLIALARQQPGKLTFGSPGVGSLGHLAGELFTKAAGIEVIHVPFKGSADVVAAALGGHVDFIVNDAAIQHVKDGRLKGLAIFVDSAFPGVPQVPPIGTLLTDAKIPGNPMGVLAPRGVPRPIMEALTAGIERACAEPAFRERMTQLAVAAQWQPPAEFRRLLVQGREAYGGVIREKGIRE